MVFRGADMNKTYEISNKFDSNNGIYEAFYAEVVAPAYSAPKALGGISEKVKKLCKILTSATAKRLAMTAMVALSLLGIVGIAGGIQHGNVSLLGGLAIAALCVGVEYYCLKKIGKIRE